MQSVHSAIILILLVNLTVAAALLVYLLRRRTAIDGALMLLLATGLIWSLGYAVELALDSEFLMLVAMRFQYIAFVSGSVGWLLLALHLHGGAGSVRPRLLLGLWVVPLLTLGLVFTSDFHALFFVGHQFIAFGDLSLLDNQYGPLFWLHIGYSYLLNLIAAALIINTLFDPQRFFLNQRLGLAIALILPWLANAAYVFRLYPLPIDFSPVAIGISGVLLVFGVFRQQLGDLLPVARERVFQDMKDGFLVIDAQLRVVDFNRAMRDLLRGLLVGQPVAQALAEHPKLLTLLERRNNQGEIIYTGFGDRVHRIATETLEPEGSERSQLVTFHDLSSDSRLENGLRLVLEGTSDDLGEDFFRSLTRSLALVLNARLAMVAELTPQDPAQARTLSFWSGDGYRENFTYSLHGAPCENVTRRGTCFYPQDVCAMFPEDQGLADMGVEAYLGTPLHNYAGEPIGLLAVMDTEPFADNFDAQSLLEIFAMRAAAEIERRRNEARIQASEQNYRRIVESTRDGVCVVDGRGTIEFVNDPMALLLGRRRDSLVGVNLLDTFDVDAQVREQMTAVTELDIECTLRVGRMAHHVAIRKTALDENKEGHGSLFVLSDQTEQQQLEEKNRVIEEQLQHSQKLESLGALAGGVAHDFNNLLMPILGYLDLIKQRAIEDEVVNDYLGRIQTAGGKLADLCNQMLTYSGKGHFSETILAINDKIDEMHDLVRASVSRNIGLAYHLGDQLPMIRADATQLNQVVMNLLLNASEAMNDSGGGEIVVETGATQLASLEDDRYLAGEQFLPGEYVYVRVRDQGIGMTEEDLQRMFEPFYSTKFTGRGLGMAVVYGIVRAHNGVVHVDSMPGAGTTVTIYFPSSRTSGLVPASRPDGSDALRGRVLVVDDEPFVRDLLKGMLENIGYEVLEAGDGASGLNTFEQQRDILACVLDLTMPGMGGAELLARIRELDPVIPVLLVSGYSQSEFVDQDLHAVNVSFLQKPFTLEQFKTVFVEQIAGDGVVH